MDGVRNLIDRLLGRPPRPRALRPNRWTIEEAERRIRRERVEWAFVFDPAGRQVIRRRGTARTVSFEATDLLLLRNAVVVHNHPLERNESPRGQPLSWLDLVFAIRYDVREMRVVSGDWRFVLQRPLGGWPADEEIVLVVYEERRAEVVLACTVLLDEGRIDPADFEAAVLDETMRRVAAWAKAGYDRGQLAP